jgi:hypothetical protein
MVSLERHSPSTASGPLPMLRSSFCHIAARISAVTSISNPASASMAAAASARAVPPATASPRTNRFRPPSLRMTPGSLTSFGE